MTTLKERIGDARFFASAMPGESAVRCLVEVEEWLPNGECRGHVLNGNWHGFFSLGAIRWNGGEPHDHVVLWHGDALVAGDYNAAIEAINAELKE